jgi:zinc and cadmium transporter
MELAISGIAGFMLGVGLLHMLPHAQEAIGDIDRVVRWVLAGFLAMFFIERFFRYHHHEVPEAEAEHADGHGHGHGHDHGHDHAHLQAHDHGHSHAPKADAHADDHAPHTRRLSWGGAAVGLSLHSIIDGVALAAATAAGHSLDATAAAAGVSVFLVILLHRPFDSMTLVTLMSTGGWSSRARHVVNGLFALAIPVGVLAFYVGLGTAHGSAAVGCALAFSAGTFLCISTSDLLPELQFHAHDRVPLSIIFLLGLGLAWGVSRFEAHDHPHGHAAAAAQVGGVHPSP